MLRLSAPRCQLWWILCAVIPLSCYVHEVDETPEIPVDLPETFSSSGAGSQKQAWWEGFQDDTLTSLVNSAFEDNLGLLQAWERLYQARALARSAGASLFPQVNLNGTAGRRKSVARTSMGTTSSTANTFSLTLVPSYELDLWGRIRSTRNASEADVEASQQELQSTALSLASEVARTWYATVTQRAMLELLKKQLEVNARSLDLLEWRFNQGMVGALSVYQQKQQFALTRSRIPPARSELEVLKHKLSVLLGRSPREEIEAEGRKLPDLPPLPRLGIPAELVRRRPDVRAVERRVVASDWRLGAAIADRFPKLSLTGGAGDQAADISDLFERWSWNVMGNMMAPLIDGGRRAWEVERRRAVLRETVHMYADSVLRAFREVEDALSREKHQKDYLKELEKEIQVVRKNLKAARIRFFNGQGDYLPVLSALNTLQELEIEHLRGRQALVNYRISLYQAIGGSWTSELYGKGKRGSFAKKAEKVNE